MVQIGTNRQSGQRRPRRPRGEVGEILLRGITQEFPFGVSREKLLETFRQGQDRNAAAKRLGKLIQTDVVRESLTINGSHELLDLRGRGLIGVQIDSHDIRKTISKRLRRVAEAMHISMADKSGYMRPIGALFGEIEGRFPAFREQLPRQIAQLRKGVRDRRDKEIVEARIAELQGLKLPVPITQESIVRSIIDRNKLWLDDLASHVRGKAKRTVAPIVLLDAKIVHGASFDILLSVLYRSDHDLMAFVRDVVQMTPFVKQTQTMSVAVSIGLRPTEQREAAYEEMRATPLTKDFLRMDDV